VNDQIIFENVLENTPFNTEGRLLIGKNAESTSFYSGFLHDLRIWEKPLGLGSIYSQMSKTLSGSEVGLIGYWTMDEIDGIYAQDKARNHHLLLNGAAWRVFPTGYAQTFNGTGNVSFNTGSSVVLTNEMDYTVEFWFKAQQQTNTVLFSNGRGDGSDPSPAFENIWVLGFNETGKLFAKNSGNLLVAEEDFQDGKWHHLALIVKRDANTQLFIDGNLKSYDQSTNFGGLLGAEMTLGARRYFSGGMASFDQNFSGSIDEFRIWKLAKTNKLIDLERFSKLTGDEIGLLAYYPFDKYDINLVIQPSLQNCDYEDNGTPSVLLAVAQNSSAENADVPNIKDARPTQKITNYNWVVNEDNIILTIDEDPKLIENCILEFTVQNVEDLNENRMLSPISWTAFVDRNTIVWEDNYKEFENVLYQPLTFTTYVKNMGGKEENFQISNLPAWLSADKTSGTLMPLSSEKITFTVNQSINIGNYETSVFLTSGFGYNEKLIVKIKVFKEPPLWSVDAENFQYSMGIVGQIKIDGKFSTNPDDKLATFVGDECRGVANLNYVKEYDFFEAFLNIYSNYESGEPIYFKIWNASVGTVHSQVTPNIEFEMNTFFGTPSQPEIFETTNSYTNSVELVNGWRWVSFNLSNANVKNINDLFGEIKPVTGDIIKGQTLFDTYESAMGWTGSLSLSGGVKPQEMYMVKMSKSETLTFTGAKINPAEVPILLKSGWNWIGFVPQVNIEVKDAFMYLTPNQGDIIKSQSAFAMYDVSTGWIGNLNFLTSGKGYMYKNTKFTTETLIYPSSGLVKTDIENESQQIYLKNLNFNADKYQNNLTVVGELIFENQEINSNFIVVAYSEKEVRGYTQPLYVNGKWRYFLSVHSNNNDELIKFKVLNLNDLSETQINENFVFENNKNYGDLENPFVFTANLETTAISHLKPLTWSVVPNPNTGKFIVDISQNKNMNYSNNKLIITNISGKTIYSTIINSSKTDIDLSNKAAGIYFVKLIVENQVLVEKVVLE
jgi:hypothetical protein